MYTYNITALVNHSIVDNWMQWQKETNIPELMATGCFSEYRFCRLLDHDETEGKTFIIQLFADSKNDYENFVERFDNDLRKKAFDKWGNDFVAFRTLLENV